MMKCMPRRRPEQFAINRHERYVEKAIRRAARHALPGKKHGDALSLKGIDMIGRKYAAQNESHGAVIDAIIRGSQRERSGPRALISTAWSIPRNAAIFESWDIINMKASSLTINSLLAQPHRASLMIKRNSEMMRLSRRRNYSNPSASHFNEIIEHRQ